MLLDEWQDLLLTLVQDVVGRCLAGQVGLFWWPVGDVHVENVPDLVEGGFLQGSLDFESPAPLIPVVGRAGDLKQAAPGEPVARLRGCQLERLLAAAGFSHEALDESVCLQLVLAGFDRHASGYPEANAVPGVGGCTFSFGSGVRSLPPFLTAGALGSGVGQFFVVEAVLMPARVGRWWLAVERRTVGDIIHLLFSLFCSAFGFLSVESLGGG